MSNGIEDFAVGDTVRTRTGRLNHIVTGVFPADAAARRSVPFSRSLSCSGGRDQTQRYGRLRSHPRIAGKRTRPPWNRGFYV